MRSYSTTKQATINCTKAIIRSPNVQSTVKVSSGEAAPKTTNSLFGPPPRQVEIVQMIGFHSVSDN